MPSTSTTAYSSPCTPSQFLSGEALLRSGRLQEAREAFRRALVDDPRHSPSLHLLGTIAYRQRRWQEAVDLFRRASWLDPDNAEILSNLGSAFQAQGKFDHALQAHQQAYHLAPDSVQVLNNLGIALSALGRPQEAISILRQAYQQAPNDAEVLCNLGAALRAQRLYDDALQMLRQAIELQPDLAVAHYNLGNTLHERGKLAEAIDSFQRVIFLAPDFPQAHVNMAIALLSMQRAADAALHCREALRLRPNDPEAYLILGNASYDQHDLDEAVKNYTKSLELNPRVTAPRYNLGLAYQSQGRLTEARNCFEDVLRRKPEDHIAHSTYLSTLIYDPNVEGPQLLAEHTRWAERHANALLQLPSFTNVPDPERRLRVGYVSPDFRNHAVAFFLEPILASHDPTSVESYCYADVVVPDSVTERFRTLAHHWHNTSGMSDEELAGLVRRDQIDILVDLAGHTAKHRLFVFARKPAPIQVNYLGYPATTGLPTVDYRIVDHVTAPPGEPDEGCEELVQLEHSFCCYAPPHTPYQVAQVSAEENQITFGGLHKLEKLNPAVIELWSSILRNVPTSRLLLCRNTLHGNTAERIIARFVGCGIDPSRLIVEHTEALNMRHLAVYHRIDVAFDTFPWNGHTTACEALWMGVPVVALRGQRHSARMVASVLSAAGLPELIADDLEAYRRIAVDLAKDIDRRVQLRRELRARLLESPLCNRVAFTRCLEDSFRTMWRRWCTAHARPQTVDTPA